MAVTTAVHVEVEAGMKPVMHVVQVAPPVGAMKQFAGVLAVVVHVTAATTEGATPMLPAVPETAQATQVELTH